MTQLVFGQVEAGSRVRMLVLGGSGLAAAARETGQERIFTYVLVKLVSAPS